MLCLIVRVFYVNYRTTAWGACQIYEGRALPAIDRPKISARPGPRWALDTAGQQINALRQQIVDRSAKPFPTTLKRRISIFKNQRLAPLRGSAHPLGCRRHDLCQSARP